MVDTRASGKGKVGKGNEWGNLVEALGAGIQCGKKESSWRTIVGNLGITALAVELEKCGYAWRK